LRFHGGNRVCLRRLDHPRRKKRCWEEEVITGCGLPLQGTGNGYVRRKSHTRQAQPAFQAAEQNYRCTNHASPSQRPLAPTGSRASHVLGASNSNCFACDVARHKSGYTCLLKTSPRLLYRAGIGPDSVGLTAASDPSSPVAVPLQRPFDREILALFQGNRSSTSLVFPHLFYEAARIHTFDLYSASQVPNRFAFCSHKRFFTFNIFRLPGHSPRNTAQPFPPINRVFCPFLARWSPPDRDRNPLIIQHLRTPRTWHRDCHSCYEGSTGNSLPCSRQFSNP
jgi:hypothetical protein